MTDIHEAPAHAKRERLPDRRLSKHFNFQGVIITGNVATCTKCGSETYVEPLHGERGGPPYCPICAGAWHAEHGRKRRAARVLIKTMKGYEQAGGSLWGKDFDELKLAAGGFDYLRRTGAEADFSDLTTELLAATLALTHPDKHPPELKAEANRVTQELLALRPFVFPAPEPEPPPKPPSDVSSNNPRETLNETSQRAYPCIDCTDALPSHYCNACRERYDREWDEQEKIEDAKRKKANERQRQRYDRRRNAFLETLEFSTCSTCGEEFEPKRLHARYCCHACRQRAYVKRGGKQSNARPQRREDIEATILDAFVANAKEAAFTTDDLCELIYPDLRWPERKRRATVVAAAKRVCERLGKHWDWMESHGHTLVFFNYANVRSYGIAHMREWCSTNADAKERLTNKDWDYHELIAEGGSWWQHCQDAMKGDL